MAKRGKVGQAKHDRKVQKELEKFIDQDFRTWADLPGRTKPPKVGGRVPDIYARKGKKLVVEEIETVSTKNADKQQQKQLRKGTKKLGGKFFVKTVK
ncbi:MAG: hypothetical protein PHI73_00420 [Patescibacteria group bacterium]|nr:hypothetical protein [Patescibacteria group bacterium]